MEEGEEITNDLENKKKRSTEFDITKKFTDREPKKAKVDDQVTEDLFPPAKELWLQSRGRMSLSLMPQDVIGVIVGYLDLKSLIRLSNTCCWFRKTSCSFVRELEAPDWMEDGMIKRFTRLKSLTLGKSSKITDEGIEGMGLTELDLYKNRS